MFGRLITTAAVIFSCLTAVGCSTGSYEDGAAAYYRQDYVTALRNWLPLAENGDAKAQYALGEMYDAAHAEGPTAFYSTPTDKRKLRAARVIPRPSWKDEAIYWYRLAAAQGFAMAQYSLGVIYQKGKAPREAMKWYRLAAAQGMARAQFSVGLAFARGSSVERDLDEAARWFRLAADQGHSPAQLAWKRLKQQVATGLQASGDFRFCSLFPSKYSQIKWRYSGIEYETAWRCIFRESISAGALRRPRPNPRSPFPSYTCVTKGNTTRCEPD